MTEKIKTLLNNFFTNKKASFIFFLKKNFIKAEKNIIK